MNIYIYFLLKTQFTVLLAALLAELAPGCQEPNPARKPSVLYSLSSNWPLSVSEGVLGPGPATVFTH